MPTHTHIFLNLPVKNVKKSVAFFTALGYGFNPQFAGDHSACVVFGDTVSVMLTTHDQFAKLSPLPVADPFKTKEILISLACSSRAQVDDLVQKAVAAGGTIFEDATDHGFMYDHSFIDPDGHGWGLFWMNPDHGQK